MMEVALDDVFDALRLASPEQVDETDAEGVIGYLRTYFLKPSLSSMCTGVREKDGSITHDGTSCPLHENPAPQWTFEYVDIADAESAADLKLAAKVITTVENVPLHVGDLFYNGSEWYFIKYQSNGEQEHPMVHIPVDPDGEQALITEREEIAVDPSTTEGTKAAKFAALEERRRVHRDANQELAEIGAKLQARRWWPRFVDQL